MIAAALGQRGADQPAAQSIDLLMIGTHGRIVSRGDLEVLRRDQAAAGERRGHRQHVLELADIARPVVREQPCPRLGSEPRPGLEPIENPLGDS